MTREEAIAILDGFKHNPLFNEQHFEALDMAISALSENRGDLISRQAVLDGIAEWIVSGYADSEADCSHISSLVTHLPSVENKGDLISRQAVINAIANTCFWLSADNWNELIKCINSISSVENKCFDGMTNGEVIQALFPNCVKSTDNEGWFITTIDVWTAFTPKWWNAPYQKGGE